MTKSSRPDHDLLNNLVDRYVREGYDVLKEPGPDAIPFDLGGYRPDLIADKGAEHLIIDVKPEAERTSFDRLRSVAGEVKRHDGWRFFLVTGQDVEETTLPGLAKESFSWGEISRQLNEAELLGLQRGPALSFIALWVAFERMMRFQSRSIALPIDRLESPAMMIGQLYSNGELSIEQFEMATNLVRIRNQVFHGLDVPADDLKRLHAPGS